MAHKPTFEIQKLIKTKGELKWIYVSQASTLEIAKNNVIFQSKRDKNGRYMIVKNQTIGIYEEGKKIN